MLEQRTGHGRYCIPKCTAYEVILARGGAPGASTSWTRRRRNLNAMRDIKFQPQRRQLAFKPNRREKWGQALPLLLDHIGQLPVGAPDIDKNTHGPGFP